MAIKVGNVSGRLGKYIKNEGDYYVSIINIKETIASTGRDCVVITYSTIEDLMIQQYCTTGFFGRLCQLFDIPIVNGEVDEKDLIGKKAIIHVKLNLPYLQVENVTPV